MNKRLSIIIAAVVIVIGLVVVFQKQDFFKSSSGDTVQLGPVKDSGKPIKGENAPDFVLQDYQDEMHSLSDYRGQIVVLNFWATWCPFCVDEMPDFQEVYDEYKDQGVVVVGVNRGESKQRAQEYSEDLKVNYPLFVNRPDDVAQAYLIRGMPTTFFIDQAGKIAEVRLGPMDAEEIKARLHKLFNLGEEVSIPKDLTKGLDAAEVPKKVKQSSRTISVTGGVKHSVPLNSILSGGPAKDGIPSIDNPKFESIKKADEYLDDAGIGIAVSFNGVERFYPFQILVWHEIVNDNIGGQPALITYCPLCGTGIVFDPIVNSKVTEFGTSGKLWNSNLVMYDRQTDSYWSQILGEAIVGEMTGSELALLPHQNISYANWKKENFRGEVLSRDTGARRNYLSGPYEGYSTSDRLIFPVENEDDRYGAKAITYGLEIDGITKAYPLEELEKGSNVFKDTVGDVAVFVQFNSDNQTVKFIREDNDEEVIAAYGFWFAWVAIHPDTEVYQAGK